MDIDAKCYDAVAGAGLEPILSGGRGQASGFIMRMMAENKRKHEGQYRNPSNNNYGSTMKKFSAFDYNRLANSGQNGRNRNDYGASPFIVKHFGSPEHHHWEPRASRSAPESAAQKAARKRFAKSAPVAAAEAVAEEAPEEHPMADEPEPYDGRDAKMEKIKKFLTDAVGIRKAKKLLGELRDKKFDEEHAKYLASDEYKNREQARADIPHWQKELPYYMLQKAIERAKGSPLTAAEYHKMNDIVRKESGDPDFFSERTKVTLGREFPFYRSIANDESLDDSPFKIGWRYGTSKATGQFISRGSSFEYGGEDGYSLKFKTRSGVTVPLPRWDEYVASLPDAPPPPEPEPVKEKEKEIRPIAPAHRAHLESLTTQKLRDILFTLQGKAERVGKKSTGKFGTRDAIINEIHRLQVTI